MPMLNGLFSRRRRYNDLDVSIQEHLAETIDELMADGMSLQDATAAARRQFGSVTQIAERSREAWQFPAIESVWADVKFALRQLIKAPGFTLTAVVTLALGISVNATMFSLVSAFLFPKLPGHDPQSMVVVSSVNPDGSFLPDASSVSAPNYLAWRADTRVFSDMAAADQYRTGNLAGQGSQPESVQYAAISPNYFSIFGVSAPLGRIFVAGDDQPGRDHVIILSHGLWERRFGSDPNIIGRTMRLNREDYVVIGVMSADFRLMGFTPQLWTPLTLAPSDNAEPARKDRSLFLFARLAPGVTLNQARAEMSTLARRAQDDFPNIESRWGANVRTLPDFLVYYFGIRTAMAIIMTVVSFVLLIACANVAGLLLTRAAARQKELAIRVSLGASRVRVIRQMITEGLVIALLGGAVGLLLTWFGIQILRAGLTFNEAISEIPINLDTKVLCFVLAVSLLSALLSSLAPALKASHSQINTDLKSESRGASAGRSHGRMRAILVGGEIALALCLLVGSSLLIRGIFMLEHQKLGFVHDHLLTAGLVLDQQRYSDSTQQMVFTRSLLSRLQQLPGVESAALASDLPSTGGARVPFLINGQPSTPAGEHHTTLDAVITTDYFRVVGIPLLRGRAFTETDAPGAPRVVLVNQEFVHRYFQDRDPLGKQIQLDLKDANPAWSSIVGVVSDIKSYSEMPKVDPQVYEPFLQRPVSSFSLMLRTGADPNSLIPDLRNTTATLDPELPLLHVLSMDAVIDGQSNGNPLFTHLLGTFALLALILAAIGIYGLVAYSVGQRTHEIGIRLALGAKASDISWMILKEGFKIAIIGSAVGLVLALPLPRIFNAAFDGFNFGAPIVYPIALAALLIVALVATYGPARSATRVDPNSALRND